MPQKDRIRSLVLDHACGQIARHLEDAGHQAIMLKGDTIASWLYAEPAERPYGDLDVLVSPAEEAAVVESLAALGYRPLFDTAWRATSPEEQPLRNHLGVVIDLHVSIKGIRVAPQRAWDVLSRETVPWTWAGTPVRALAPHARAMHLALHVSQGGLADEKAARDLALGLARLDSATWHAADRLARRLEAVEAFSAGLRLFPEGARLADELGLAQPEHLETRMRAGSAPNASIVLERTLTTEGWRQRTRVAFAHVFPSAAWLRVVLPAETRTTWGLVRARARRPFILLGRLPAAIRTRRRYRRSLAGDDR